MPTQSEDVQSFQPNAQSPGAEWAARTNHPPRSVFGNYRSPAQAPAASPSARQDTAPDLGPETSDSGLSLQSAIDTALARSFVYRFLAQAYEDPTEESWSKLCNPRFQRTLDLAVRAIAADEPALANVASALRFQLTPARFEASQASYLRAFGHAARGRCPLNEIEYGDIKADPLFQPHRLADLAAFYRAFGLEEADDAGERHDHICLELEFMCVLAAKEAYALERQLNREDLVVCREAQKKFLREHLGRWVPAFTHRLEQIARDTPLASLANFTRSFIEAECARYGVVPGSEDLLLRPVDEAAESLCASCNAGRPSP